MAHAARPFRGTPDLRQPLPSLFYVEPIYLVVQEPKTGATLISQLSLGDFTDTWVWVWCLLAPQRPGREGKNGWYQEVTHHLLGADGAEGTG
jgi:hypothetical protein